MKNNVCVILEVYNEAHRLEECLKNFKWAEELVVFIKKSQDNSLEIAKKHATHTYESNFNLVSNNIPDNFKRHNTKKEWCFYITASSKIDESLVLEIEKLTSNDSFEFDVIGLPFEMNVFGLSGDFSPWNNNYKYSLIRRSVLILSDKIHNEISWKGNKVYKIDRLKTNGRIYHYTHSNPDIFFERHIRYTKVQASQLCIENGTMAFKKAFNLLIRSLLNVFIKNRTIYKGRNGFVLSLAYVSYYMMLLIYVWFYKKKHNNLN